MDKKNIILLLDEYEFHDAEIHNIQFSSPEGRIQFIATVLPFNAQRKKHELLTLIFSDISSLSTSQLVIEERSELELYSFEYTYDQIFICRMQFLTGFGKPSWEVKLNCNKINVNHQDFLKSDADG